MMIIGVYGIMCLLFVVIISEAGLSYDSALSHRSVCKVQSYISGAHRFLMRVTSQAPIPDVYCGRVIVINASLAIALNTTLASYRPRQI